MHTGKKGRLSKDLRKQQWARPQGRQRLAKRIHSATDLRPLKQQILFPRIFKYPAHAIKVGIPRKFVPKFTTLHHL